MDQSERKIAETLSKYGLAVRTFSKSERTQSKTPDFKVFSGDELAFYCEVKAIARDEWLGRQLDEASPGTLVGGLRCDPRYNRISTKIHEAVAQFDAVNPSLDFPNVLAFVNYDRGCGAQDLVAVTTGHFQAVEGGRHPIFMQYSEGRIKEEKFRVHLYMWIDCHAGDLYLFNTDAVEFLSTLSGYFDIDPATIEPIIDSHG